MNDIQLYVKEPTDVNYTRLDLFKDETISLTQTIQDVKDPGKVFTNFSKTFSLPASKTNNKFFKHFENFIQSETYSFDARKKKQAKIELNSLPFQKGQIRLEGVDLKNGRPDTYRITFFGELDLKEILGDLKLQDLDWLDNFDTTYTNTKVQSSLESINGTGSISTPISDSAPVLVSLIGNSQRAYFDNTNTTPAYFDNTKAEVNKQGGNLYVSNTNLSGYYWKDLVYSIRVYLIIKAIENSDSTKDTNGNKQIIFSDDFFNTTNKGFYNLYMLCQRNAGKILEGLGDSYTPNKQNFKSYANASNQHPNNLLLYQSSFRIYNLPSYALFSFTITVNFTNTTGNIYVDLREKTSNTIVTTFSYSTTQSGGLRSFVIGNGTYELIFRSDNGETVDTFTVSFVYANATTTAATGDLDAGFTIPSEGFSIKQNIPDIKIIDFLSGLFKIFNLTAYKEDGKIYVKTLDDFYEDGTIRDVTDYVDSTTKTLDKALPYREIQFKYEDTDNILAKQHKEQFQKEWGAVNYNADGALDSNNEVYEIIPPFQHMKFERLNGTSTNIQVGHLLDDKQEAYLGKPVLYYPIHTSTLGVSTNLSLLTEIQSYDGGSQTNRAVVEDYWIPSNTPAVSQSGAAYPESLHFNVEINEWTLGPEYTDTLFEKYYKSYITNVFRFNERLTKIKARLPLSFLQEYTLADELQISDLTYRINSITTNLQTGESTLELLNGVGTVVATGVGSVAITISSQSNATPGTVCGYTLNTTVYYSGTLGNGTTLYTDAALNTAYTGSGTNHAFPGSYYGIIDANGVIAGYQPCPSQAPTMTTSTTTNITYQSFTMNGSLDVANGTVTEKGFYYGTNPTYNDPSNTKIAEGTTSSGTYQKTILSGISAGTTYYVTAYAINQYGEGIGTTLSHQTPTAPIPPTVTAEPADNVGPYSFTAELEITSDGGATINGAGFYMGTNSAAATNNPHYDITPAPTSIGTKQYDFSNLLAATTYYYWGTATNTYSSTKGVSSTYTTVTTDPAPTGPTVIADTVGTITSSSFVANIDITSDGGSSITSAGVWYGTDSSAYNAAGNTFVNISTTSTGQKSTTITSVNGNTTYYYWGSATNSQATTVSSNYITLQTLQQVYSYNAYYNTSAFTACVQSTTTTYYSYTSTWQAGMVLYTTNTSGTLSGLAPDGNYRLNPNKYHVISGGNGTLGAEQNCNLNVYRLKITADYVSGTNFYDLTTVLGESLSTTDYLYQAGGVFGSDSLVYTDENLTTTPTYGLGTYDQDHSSDLFRFYYGNYPDQKIFAAKSQAFNSTTQQWYDNQANYTRFYQMDSSGYLKRLYWNYPNGDLYYDSNNPSTAGLTGIKISSSGSADAVTACTTTPTSIVYFAGTTLGNNTVLYTDSVSAGQAKTTEKFNGSNQWYKFENNYRAQISSSGVVSNYASC